MSGGAAVAAGITVGGTLRQLAHPYPTAACYPRLARALAPRRPLKVSEWADRHRRLSTKGSAEAGRWRTERNPPLREPMDALHARAGAREVVCMWPIQFGKTELALNLLGYTMHHHPGPTMVCLPGEVSLNKWVAQKLQPMLDETEAVRETLTSLASREATNTRTFKDFSGGQLYVEHAGSPSRLKSSSVRTLIVDELDEFAANLVSGDDPVQMLNGRTSAFPSTYQRLYISSPQMRSTSRIHYLWERSDQRRYHVPCPHCGHEQVLQWAGLHWQAEPAAGMARRAWYVCAECGSEIEEGHKTAMIAAGRWIPAHPEHALRGYHINCLYYPIGLGPRWGALVEEWLDAQGDPARLKTFINDRLAEPWEDKSTANVRANVVAERAEAYPLRVAPAGVLRVTAGVDTQDDRLEVHIVGWGRGLAFWVLDYVVLSGDTSRDEVWTALTELLNRPIEHAHGATLAIEATSVDMLGHRTEAVKAWVRARRVRRPMASFGAVQATAPVLGKARLQDVTWRGQTDKRGVHIYQLGTVNAKHVLFARLAADADALARWEGTPTAERAAEGPERSCHFSDQLPPEYFAGLISEAFDPAKNRFVKRRGAARNEPLDTWVHAYAAAHHPELRLHRATRADWERWEAAIRARTSRQAVDAASSAGRDAAPTAPADAAPTPARSPRQRGRIGPGFDRRF